MRNLPIEQYKVFSLSHLAVIAVKGDDAAKFLQGQLTCDIHGLAEYQSTIAAFCNAKGRVISTLLVLRTPEAFMLILPACLLDKTEKKLRMYILRSSVNLSDHTANCRLFGIVCQPGAEADPREIDLGFGETIAVKLPASPPRFLCFVGSGQNADIPFCQQQSIITNGDEWRYYDIGSGFPWFEETASEQYIPQMLNIDRLGGVSFNKGCYTGQEIIARTHYLGKTKRALYPCETENPLASPPTAGMAVIDLNTGQTAGNVVIVQTHSQSTRFLAVLQMEGSDSNQLVLDDGEQTAVKILPIE